VGDADGVFQDGDVDVVVGVHVNAAHELDEFSRFRQVVAAGSIQVLADKI
jgi:hypothetical protein